MKKLFMLIDADEFLQATKEVGDMDNGLTAAFIRGFNFCEQNKPKAYPPLNGESFYTIWCSVVAPASPLGHQKWNEADSIMRIESERMAKILNGHFGIE